VKDEAGNALQNATLRQVRTGYVYKTGAQGTYGIISDRAVDSFRVSLSGYKEELVVLNADVFATMRLKLLPATSAHTRRDKLVSLTKGLGRDEQRKWYAGEETYVNLLENGFIDASRYPNTGISPNVDRASYSNIRRFLNSGTVVPPDAVRIEEMLNYFNAGYNAPPPGNVFSFHTSLTSCPWNPANQLYFVNLSARKINLEKLPPSNLVFLIDVSASMDMPNRLPLLQSSFRMLAENLRDKDSVSIIVYGGVTGIMLNTTSGADKKAIIKAIDELVPGGATPGASGIELAYSMAKRHFIPGGNNRVILATDGDFNVGVKKEEELDELISQHRESGIYLTCLGVGMGNYKDSKIQLLARKGNGNFAYIDNFQEAQKVVLREFTQTLYAVADDTYMNVTFNDSYIKEYRLLGYDNRMTALTDSLSVVEGGEIGSGHSGIAVFELVPTEKNRAAIKSESTGDWLAQFTLRYQLPNDTAHQCQQYSAPLSFTPFNKIENCYRFATSVAMFGSLLRASVYAKNIKWEDVLAIANTATEPDNKIQQEFLAMVQKAKLIYTKQKKRKEKREKE